VPLTYAPPVADASELAIAQQEKRMVRTWCDAGRRKNRQRQLPNLQKMPILVLHFGGVLPRALRPLQAVKYLQAGRRQPSFVKLADLASAATATS